MKRFARFSALATFVLLTGCATSPVVVRADLAAPAAGSMRKPPAPGCRVHMSALSDSRSDPTILGTIGPRPVVSPGQGADWIANRLSAGLEPRGIAITFAPETPPENAVTIAEGRLVTAWVASLSTSMNGTVVFGLSARADAPEKFYRGNDTAMNWAGGEGEINRLVDRSFDEMLEKLGADLRALCRGG
jgi:hypothetical protein